MSNNPYHRQANDTVAVHPRVLRTLVCAAALEIEGVMRIGQARWLSLDRADDSIHLSFEGDDLTISLQVVVDARYNLYEVSCKVQQEVERTMQKYVGIHVKAVNVQIADVVLGTAQQ